MKRLLMLTVFAGLAAFGGASAQNAPAAPAAPTAAPAAGAPAAPILPRELLSSSRAHVPEKSAGAGVLTMP